MTTGTGLRETTYWSLIADAAERDPHRELLADDYGRSLTARQFHDAACATAAAFAERGIGSGTVVSWQLPTTIETMVVMAALARLGVVQNPIIPLLRQHEVGFITGQLKTEYFVTPDNWRGFAHGELARALAADGGFEVITVDLETPPAAGTLRLPRASIDALSAPPGPSGDARWIYYSSGTTAAPKGIRHTDASVIAGSTGVVGMVGAGCGDVDPIAFPVAHIGGAVMLAAALLTGMRLALFQAFDPAATPFAIAAYEPTFLGVATPFFVAFLEAQRAHGDSAALPVVAGLPGRRRTRHRRTRTPGAGNPRRGRHLQRLGADRVSVRDVAVIYRGAGGARPHRRAAGTGGQRPGRRRPRNRTARRPRGRAAAQGSPMLPRLCRFRP